MDKFLPSNLQKQPIDDVKIYTLKNIAKKTDGLLGIWLCVHVKLNVEVSRFLGTKSIQR